MIDIRDLTVVFNRGSVNEQQALRDINLHIENREFVVLLGSNGSGKSTLLNCIAGTHKSPKGTIVIKGTDVSRMPDFERSRYIARIFQNPLQGTAPELTILENFRLAALRGRAKGLHVGLDKHFSAMVKERIAVLGMGLESKLDQKMGSLSGGQRQALTLIMAVMQVPDILLLDEPAAALDPRSAAILMESADRVIKEFDLTALLVTHNLKDAFQYGTRVIQLQEGSVIRDLNISQKSILTHQEMQQWFN